MLDDVDSVQEKNLYQSLRISGKWFMHRGLKEKLQYDELVVEIYEDRKLLGSAAADDVAAEIRKLLKEKNTIRMIFAAAPSQDELLAELIKKENIDWLKITAFHMDEYLGLSNNAPQAFGQFLRDRIFDKVNFGKVNFLSTSDLDHNLICKEYENLLKEDKIDIVCMGIGENGHIAFNDPPYADFNDKDWVKIIQLDEVSRQQQVNDGCFEHIDSVPTKAITLTIPALLSGAKLFVVVPGKSKARAVRETLLGPVSTDCPASILRKHKNAKLYLDEDSSSLLNENL